MEIKSNDYYEGLEVLGGYSISACRHMNDISKLVMVMKIANMANAHLLIKLTMFCHMQYLFAKMHVASGNFRHLCSLMGQRK